ncbi:hypothetical protein ZEAMMB73_Zm00001d015722 [Zea mays]|uniref:Uncharacterized protein n=1 Tax=Zea mays TaxID=4577 RepID=A0A1D6H3E4_MAIZE|nr:hypothetical protein ZEAMMB73_Zm00001d015722 [Zea mays]
MDHAESATAALNCSGVVLGSLPIRAILVCFQGEPVQDASASPCPSPADVVLVQALQGEVLFSLARKASPT